MRVVYQVLGRHRRSGGYAQSLQPLRQFQVVVLGGPVTDQLVKLMAVVPAGQSGAEFGLIGPLGQTHCFLQRFPFGFGRHDNNYPAVFVPGRIHIVGGFPPVGTAQTIAGYAPLRFQDGGPH